MDRVWPFADEATKSIDSSGRRTAPHRTDEAFKPSHLFIERSYEVSMPVIGCLGFMKLWASPNLSDQSGMEWMYAFKLYPRPRPRSPIQQFQTSAFRL